MVSRLRQLYAYSEDGINWVKPDCRADCDSLTGDKVRHTVTWKGNDTLKHPMRVKLRFFMRDANLYSFQFAAAD